VSKRTPWHRIFGKVLEELLTPVDISVLVETPVMSQPPIMDILVLRNQTEHWTPAQLARLPDGIRQSDARHIIIEFKYEESFNEAALAQVLTYDTLYKANQKAEQNMVQSFVVASRSPRLANLKTLGFEEQEQPGVYGSTMPVLRFVRLISLPDLANASYNAAFKVFAHNRREKQRAYDILAEEIDVVGLNAYYVLAYLYYAWFSDKGGDAMNIDLSKVDMKLLVDTFGDGVLRSMPLEKRLEGISSRELLKELNFEQRQALYESLRKEFS